MDEIHENSIPDNVHLVAFCTFIYGSLKKKLFKILFKINIVVLYCSLEIMRNSVNILLPVNKMLFVVTIIS